MSGGELTIAGATGDPPASFMGPPGAMAGEITVTNPGDKRSYFRGCAIRVAGADATTAVEVAPMMAVGIEPGRSAQVKLQAHLDARTPPGVLRGELVLGDDRRPAMLYVTEHVELELSPPSLVVEAAAGARITRTLTLRNRGNVALTFDAPRPVTLEGEAPSEHAIAGILDSLRGTSAPRAPVVTAPPLVAVLSTAALELAPGELAVIELVVELPAGLEPGTRYVARAPFYAATLSLVVVTKT